MKKNNHDADYDRWGGAPGSIKVTKAPNKKTAKSSKRQKEALLRRKAKRNE